MASMGTFKAQLRRNFALHTSSSHGYVWWSDRLGYLRSNANETFRRLVGVSKHANVRANSSETREMCSRERVADGVVSETSHNRKFTYVQNPKKMETRPLCVEYEKRHFLILHRLQANQNGKFSKCTSLIDLD